MHGVKQRVRIVIAIAESSLATIARFGLAAVFMLAGLSKIRHPHSLRVVSLYLFAGEYARRFLPIVTAGWEILLSLLLVSGFQPALTGALASATLAAFTGVLMILNHFALDVDCGCFGPAAESGPSHIKGIIRNLVLLAMSTWVMASSIDPSLRVRLL